MHNYRVYFKLTNQGGSVTEHHTNVEVIEEDDELVRIRFWQTIESFIDTSQFALTLGIEITKMVQLN
jgi:hypothetical protein